MTEPLPEKMQKQIDFLREVILRGEMDREAISEELGIIALNAYNLGKDPSYEVIPIP